MEEDKPTVSQKVFLEVQIEAMAAMAAMVGGLLEKVLKYHVGALRFEKGCRSIVRSISNFKSSTGLQINAGS